MTQAHAFFICAALGYAFGACSLPLLAADPLPLGGRTALQALFCLLCAAAYPFLAIGLGLPPLRSYLLLGIVVGFFLYWKSLRKIVAFLLEKSYNRSAHKRQKKGKRRKCRGRSHRRKREGSP